LNIELNGEPRTTRAKSLGELIEIEGFGDTKFATALNGNFVPASARDKELLKDGDKIEIVTPRQGG